MVDTSLAPSSLPPETRVYVIGDVHGCLTQLASLHGMVASDLALRPIQDSVLVHLGDYIDRGPGSAGVVALLSEDVTPPVGRRADLCGNHEAMMCAALSEDLRAADAWLMNGGDATLASYGVSSDALPTQWAEAIPSAHRQWIASRALTHKEGGYLFVHAGIRPGRKLHRQTDEDLLWIREPFLSSQDRHPLVIVHGHTPSPVPVVRNNRIGIDTGAFMGGLLTCLVLEEDRMHFLVA